MADDAKSQDFDPATSAAGGVNPWIIALVVSLAVFMEVLDTTIANVALRYIAGGLAVSMDQASWVVTTYLVANAIILTASSFLAKRFGRRNFYLGCLALFTISSVLCGLAWNLDSILLFRVFQGFAGGGMVPLSQSILADSFPPQKRGQAFALFGVAVVVAPVVGPVLGGYLSDTYSWHWCFLINGPVGLIALVLVWFLVQEPKSAVEERKQLAKKGGVGFDLVGFLLVATFLGMLELVLDRGQTDDWFGSTFIIVATAICALAFAAMIPWCLSRNDPIIDMRMVGNRQFGACFVVMLATGAILISTTQYLPELLQSYYGYTAYLAGLALSPGGLVTMFMFVVTGRLSGFIQPKWLIALGSLIIAGSMYGLTGLNGNADFWWFAWSRMYLGLGLPLIFIPILTASYVGIPQSKTDQASALINAARNIGGSIGVSVAANTLAYRSQFHQSRMVESVVPSDPAYHDTLQQITNFFVAQGSALAEAKEQAIAFIGQQVATQSGLLGYIDVFWVLMLISAAGVPLALTLRKVNLGEGGSGGAH